MTQAWLALHRSDTASGTEAWPIYDAGTDRFRVAHLTGDNVDFARLSINLGSGACRLFDSLDTELAIRYRVVLLREQPRAAEPVHVAQLPAPAAPVSRPAPGQWRSKRPKPLSPPEEEERAQSPVFGYAKSPEAEAAPLSDQDSPPSTPDHPERELEAPDAPERAPRASPEAEPDAEPEDQPSPTRLSFEDDLAPRTPIRPRREHEVPGAPERVRGMADPEPVVGERRVVPKGKGRKRRARLVKVAKPINASRACARTASRPVRTVLVDPDSADDSSGEEEEERAQTRPTDPDYEPNGEDIYDEDYNTKRRKKREQKE